MLIKEQSDLVMFPVLRESRVYFLRVFFFFFFLFSNSIFLSGCHLMLGGFHLFDFNFFCQTLR